MFSRLDRKRFAAARRDPDIEIARIRGNPVHRTFLPPKLPTHDADDRSIVVGDFGNLLCRNILVPGRGHLKRRGEVRPQLEPVHAAAWVSLRHFLVKDPAPCRHPLHIARTQRAAISETVPVFDCSSQDVRDGFDSPVRVPWKSRGIGSGIVIPKIVQQEKWIEVFRRAETECAAQADPRPFNGGLGLGDSFDRSYGHCPPFSVCDQYEKNILHLPVRSPAEERGH